MDKSYRRKGIGSKLIRTLQKYASKNLLDKIQLVALESFTINFYKKLGFKVTKELPNFLPYSKGTLMEFNV